MTDKFRAATYCKMIFYMRDENGQAVFIRKGSTAALSTEITRYMTFTGTFFGMFAENMDAAFCDFSGETQA